MTFKELGLQAGLVRALEELGYEHPTPIQEQAIPQVLQSKKDLIALAQTGTGKTAAFSLPILEQLYTDKMQIQCIVLCPTRELCLQITNDMQQYAKYMELQTVAVYGGASIDTQVRAIKRGCQVVIGTPGRTVDLIKRGVLKLQDIRFVVLDEADEMLTMGFKEDLDKILAQTPDSKQTLLFSATMPNGIRDIVHKYMHKPAEVTAGQRNAGATNIEHQYYLVNAKDKYECLKRLADMNPDIYGIVFCRTRRETKDIADKLMQDGYNADVLNGDLSQGQRDHIMQRFRKKKIHLLVATDVAARGLDVDDLTHIINFNLPDEEEVYIHRSGRTGRAGKTGISIAIIHKRETGKLKNVERKLQKPIKQMPVPTGKEICERQLYAIVERLGQIECNEKQIEPFLPAIMDKLEHLSKEDLIKHLVAFEFNRFLNYYKHAPDLNIQHERNDRPERNGKKRERSRSREDSTDFTRFHINLGKKDGVNAPVLMGIINESLRKGDVEIGKIEVLGNFSFFELDSAYGDKLQQAMKDFEREGKPVDISIAKSTGTPFRGKEKKKRSKKPFRAKAGGDYSRFKKKRKGNR